MNLEAKKRAINLIKEFKNKKKQFYTKYTNKEVVCILKSWIKEY